MLGRGRRREEGLKENKVRATTKSNGKMRWKGKHGANQRWISASARLKWGAIICSSRKKKKGTEHNRVWAWSF